VLVATPTTLLTSLISSDSSWRFFEDQNKHTAELAERAGKVYDKLRTFLGSMDGIETKPEKSHRTLQKARDHWSTGGTLVKQILISRS